MVEACSAGARSDHWPLAIRDAVYVRQGLDWDLKICIELRDAAGQKTTRIDR